MGFLKKIGKSVSKAFKKSIKLTGKVTGIDWLTNKVKKPLQDMFGITAQKDQAMRQEEAIRKQGEASKLDANNEIDNVVQFDDAGADFYGGGYNRRNKRKTGAFSSGIGLNY